MSTFWGLFWSLCKIEWTLFPLLDREIVDETLLLLVYKKFDHSGRRWVILADTRGLVLIWGHLWDWWGLRWSCWLLPLWVRAPWNVNTITATEAGAQNLFLLLVQIQESTQIQIQYCTQIQIQTESNIMAHLGPWKMDRANSASLDLQRMQIFSKFKADFLYIPPSKSKSRPPLYQLCGVLPIPEQVAELMS